MTLRTKRLNRKRATRSGFERIGLYSHRLAKGIETPLNVQLPAVIEPTLFDISPN